MVIKLLYAFFIILRFSTGVCSFRSQVEKTRSEAVSLFVSAQVATDVLWTNQLEV